MALGLSRRTQGRWAASVQEARAEAAKKKRQRMPKGMLYPALADYADTNHRLR